MALRTSPRCGQRSSFDRKLSLVDSSLVAHPREHGHDLPRAGGATKMGGLVCFVGFASFFFFFIAVRDIVTSEAACTRKQNKRRTIFVEVQPRGGPPRIVLPATKS